MVVGMLHSPRAIMRLQDFQEQTRVTHRTRRGMCAIHARLI